MVFKGCLFIGGISVIRKIRDHQAALALGTVLIPANCPAKNL